MFCVSVLDAVMEKRSEYAKPVEAKFAAVIGSVHVFLAAIFPLFIVILDIPTLKKHIKYRMIRNIRTKTCH